MPVYVPDQDRFLEIAKNAVECRVKRVEKKGIVKLKARTKRYLYTYIVTADQANEAIEKLKSVCKTIKEV
uniref:50S ribosomal protein L38e n=1 Tax=Ignisphaera aggregans TaxID=334771 RepID=A0A7C2ZPI1_9CREN